MSKSEQFLEFHQNHPEIYAMFKHYCFSAIDSGKKKYSARAIMERLRWELNIDHSGEYKINDHCIPYYARQFLSDYPQHKDFFELRTLSQPDTL